MDLTPVDFIEPTRDPKDSTETHKAGGRVFIADHWAVRSDGTTHRLGIGDSRQGKLRWTLGEDTTRFADLMKDHEGHSWNAVADWSVSSSGKRLWCIAGRFELRTKKHYWSSGAFYVVDVETNEVTPIYEPVVRTDRMLRQVAALGEDDVLLMSERALRWFRHGNAWTELTRLRIKDGDRMAVGIVDDRRLALVKAGGPSLGTTNTLLIEIGDGELTKIGEILVPVRDICFDGRALVRTPDGWHALTIPPIQTKARKQAAKKATRKKVPKHPLKNAMLELERVDPPVRPVTDAIRGLIDSRGPSPINARMCGPDVAAGVHRKLQEGGDLVIVRSGKEIARIETPYAIRFEVTPDGKHAFILARSKAAAGQSGASKALLECDVENSKEWKPIAVDGSGLWGPDGIACFDENQLVVKSDKSLEFLIRDGGTWKATHRVKCPVGASLRSYPAKDCVVLASSKLVLYGRNSEKLQKLAETKLPKSFGGMLPTIWFTPDGRLFADGRHVKITPL